MLARRGYAYEDLSVGMTEEFSKTISNGEILSFSEATGDDNPIHLDEEFAARGFFRRRVAHGMLTASFISTIIGTLLPGPGCVYLSQNLKFLAPVCIGDTVIARVVVEALMPENKCATLKTTCVVDEKLVVEGDALVYVPSRA